jgi:hypothetical protein
MGGVAVLDNQYVVNVLSDFITLTITIIAGVVFYQVSRRRKLQSFFAMSDKRIVVYLSNLTVALGGALDATQQQRTYQGPAIPAYEAGFIPLFYQLFNSPIPGLEGQSGILSRLRLSDVDVDVQPAPVIKKRSGARDDLHYHRIDRVQHSIPRSGEQVWSPCNA